MDKHRESPGRVTRELLYSEALIQRMGIAPDIEYEVEGQAHNDGLSENGLCIKYLVEGDQQRRTFPLGLHAETRNLKAGDRVVFKVKIKKLRLSNEELRKFGVSIGDKFTVKKDEFSYEMPHADIGTYIEVNGQKVYLWNFNSACFNSRIEETRVGEILTIAGERD